MLNRAYQIGRIRALADAGVKTSADLEELGDYATRSLGGLTPLQRGYFLEALIQDRGICNQVP